jgi:hypothetical protein
MEGWNAPGGLRGAVRPRDSGGRSHATTRRSIVYLLPIENTTPTSVLLPLMNAW